MRLTAIAVAVAVIRSITNPDVVNSCLGVCAFVEISAGLPSVDTYFLFSDVETERIMYTLEVTYLETRLVH